MNDLKDALRQLDGLLRDVSEHMAQPSKANRRAAAQKLERIVAIASTLAATIHTPQQ